MINDMHWKTDRQAASLIYFGVWKHRIVIFSCAWGLEQFTSMT